MLIILEFYTLLYISFIISILSVFAFFCLNIISPRPAANYNQKMSRQAKIDEAVKDEWSCVKLWCINSGYSPFKPDKSGWIKNALVILNDTKEADHSLVDWGAISQVK